MRGNDIRKWVATALIAAGGVALWQGAGKSPSSHGGDISQPPTAGSEPRAVRHVPHPTAKEYASKLSLPEGTPQAEVQAMHSLLRIYQKALGSLPSDRNEEVVRGLMGQNPKRIAFIPVNTPVVQDGKMVDRWGSPYWFHSAVDDSLMVRSAGPDREAFTSDDLTAR